jgi:tRNA A37 methylthiotransferase MiaB
MKGHVKESVKKERSARLRTLSDDLAQRYAERFRQKRLSVLWEQVTGATEDGFINVGYTDNYIRVRGIHPRPLINRITAAEIRAVGADALLDAIPVLSIPGGE